MASEDTSISIGEAAEPTIIQISESLASETMADYYAKATAGASALINVTAVATTLAAGSDATATYNEGLLTFGIPQGVDGDSPTITITEGTGERTLTIKDKNGTDSTTIKDGVTPTASVSKEDKTVTITINGNSETVTEQTIPAFDTTLSNEGEIADAKAVGDALEKKQDTMTAGTDYQTPLTESDKQSIVLTGLTTGDDFSEENQALAKAKLGIVEATGVSLTRVWKNSDVTAAFSDKTVALSAEKSMYLVEYNSSTTTSDGTNSKIVLPGNTTNLPIVSITSANRIGNRQITILGTSANFGAAYYNAASSTANVIPTAIYGIDGITINGIIQPLMLFNHSIVATSGYDSREDYSALTTGTIDIDTDNDYIVMGTGTGVGEVYEVFRGVDLTNYETMYFTGYNGDSYDSYAVVFIVPSGCTDFSYFNNSSIVSSSGTNDVAKATAYSISCDVSELVGSYDVVCGFNTNNKTITVARSAFRCYTLYAANA